jgi:hypothetical protein
MISTTQSKRQQNFWQSMVMDGEVMWTMSFAFCGFVFLHVMGDNNVIVTFGFDCFSR